MTSTWEDRLRSQGYRVTPQREFVLRAVDDLGHATPEEILARVQQSASGVNLSTVYRTLEVLEAVGLVTHAHIGHGAPTYHSVRGDVHVHLVCRECHVVDSVPADSVMPVVDRLRRERGFTVDVAHMSIQGLCRTCREVDGDHGG